MRDLVGAQSGSKRRSMLGKRAQRFLPDDVVLNILSWLPAEDVARYRCVCKLWRELTSSKHFIDLHSRCVIPMILKEDHRGQLLLDRYCDPTQTSLNIHKIKGLKKYGFQRVVLSHNGFIVFSDLRCSVDQSAFVIYNPIYRDVVNLKIRRLRSNFKGRVCGVFFHPVQKELCILWERIVIVPSVQGKVQYRILNLESDPKWRDIATLKHWIWRQEPALIIDKHLYRILVPCEIMEYDIIKEEFRVIPCPVRFETMNINLVSIEGVVSVVEVIRNKIKSLKINIWTFNDGAGEQMWTSRNYVVACDLYAGDTIRNRPKAVAFRNGEMLLSLGSRLCGWNLKSGTFRKFGDARFSTFLPHVMTLLSLKNCKSDICIADI